jgi:hypothetical protein
MDIIWIIIAVFISSAAVFATAFLTITKFLDHEEKKHLLELRMQNQKILTPVRLQAYERMALFLERITPNGLVIRVYQQGMSSFQLQSALIRSVRDEFEHNLAQQVYISNPAWEMVRNAKEDTIKLVNIAASRLNDSATGADLSTTILELSIQSGAQPTARALDFLKEEIRKLF